ncbi:spore coat protein GerQ [Halobacillus sp. A5]|uniref:spore coat protein GerQ n=1 Tax=Halobacillus sp. A5 TaxID=2880263 RepID=UPI0020A69079|nr:spore coat protein GerQ [Halobacillus sp. A5]MCP3027520.1 spore coat protein GerQ [Halobacillus sp. A5]
MQGMQGMGPGVPYYPGNPYMYQYAMAGAAGNNGYYSTNGSNGNNGNNNGMNGMNGMQVPYMSNGNNNNGNNGNNGNNNNNNGNANGNGNMQGMLPEEESYIENILRLNRGKEATIYMTFENNEEWNAKVFKGIIEAAGRDHIIISDPQTDKRYILLMVYLDYITFDEEINYSYPYNGSNGMSNYSPR